MRLEKQLKAHLSRSQKLNTTLLFIFRFFFYFILVFLEFFFKFVFYVFFRFVFILPVYIGFLLFKLSIYLPLYYILMLMKFLFILFFKKIKNNFFKIILFIGGFYFLDFFFSKNLDYGWSSKSWFNNIKRTNSLEFDFIEYNRSVSKLLFRKNFSPINVLISEKGISEFFVEFKLKIFGGIPKFRYSQQEPTTEILYKAPFPVLYRLDIDYGDFAFLSKYSVTEVDIKDIFYLRQHKQNEYFIFNSIFNFFNQLNFKYIFDLEYFYNFNSFLKNYHDDFVIVRNKLMLQDFNLLTFKNQKNSLKNILNPSYFFYSGNSFWERFSFDSFLVELGSELDDVGNTLYIPEVDELYDYPNQFFNTHETTLLNYLFGGNSSFYQKDVFLSVGYTRSLGYAHYDFDLAERLFFWNFKFSSLSFGLDKFDFSLKHTNNDLIYSRYGVLGPLLLHDWNLFYPHFFDNLVDLGQMGRGNFKIDYFLNVQDYKYYNNFFKLLLEKFSGKKFKNIFEKYNIEDLEIKNFPPLLKIPRLNDSRLLPYENEVQGESDFFLTKYKQNIAKYPFAGLYNQQFLAKKTKIPLWFLKLGKYNHELFWSSRVLSPFSLSPTKKRMTIADFWILRKSFLKGFLSVKDVYYYLKSYKIFFLLREIENNIIFFFFNFLPSEILLVELKYLFLNFLMKASFFDQLLIFFSNFFNFDFLTFKWFFIRLLILISDVYLWFIFAYIKIIFSVLVNVFFDDINGLVLYYLKIFEIYYIDAFLPLQSSIANRTDFLFTEFFFKHDVMNDLFEILSIETDVLPRKGKKTNFITNWIRPSERNRKSLYGFYYPTQFRLFYYDIYQRPPYRKNTSFTWRRGNTILFSYGHKVFFKDFYSRKTIKLKRLMRYESGVSNQFRMHHIRMRPFAGFWPTYNFLRFNYHYGLKNYNSLNHDNLLLLEKMQFYSFNNNDLFFKMNYYYLFYNFFNTSVRPKNMLSVFKHFYFFNKNRGFNFFLPKEQLLYKYDFHYIPFSGLKKTKKLKFSIPFLDLLSFPNQYLLNKPKEPFWFFRAFKFVFGITLYKPKVPKTNYYPIMYKHSPVYQYRQYLMLLNWHALLLHGFVNTTLFFYPVDFHYKRINLRDPQVLTSNFLFNINFIQFFIAKKYADNYIKLQNTFVWSFGNHLKFWNYTSPYMERNFIDFFWLPITPLYTSRFLDDGMRLENGFGSLSYNSVFNRLYSRVKGTRNFIKKELIMFVPGTGAEPMEQFFWTHNQHDFDFFFLTQYTKEWPIHDLSTLEDNRFLNLYSQPHKNRAFMLDFQLTDKSSNTIELESGIDVFENQFSEVNNYFIWDNHKRLRKVYCRRRLRTPFDLDITRLLHFQYKITSVRKLTFFLIIVWYNFLVQIFFLIKFIIFNYLFLFLFIYLFFYFILLNISYFHLKLNSFFIQQKNLNIWLGERMLLYEKVNIKENNDKNFNFFKISKLYKLLKNSLLLNFFKEFFFFYKFFLFNYVLNLVKKEIVLNLKLSKYKILKLILIYIKKFYIYFFNFYKYKILKLTSFFYLFNKSQFFFFFFKNYIFYYILNFLKKILHFLIFFLFIFFFFIFLNKYLLFKNIYLTEISSVTLMFLLIIFLIWFLSINSSIFIKNFLTSEYPIDQYLQDYTTDFIGESFVYEDSLYFYLQPFQEDEMFDADSFPFYYAWFTQFVGTNFMLLFFANKASKLNLEMQAQSNYLAGLGKIAENSPKIYGTPAYLKNGLKNFFSHILITIFRQKDMYRFNNDISIFYEYEENLKTVTNLIININYNNSKNYKKYDLPWEVVDGYIYMQYLSNNFWYYHSELFTDTDRLLFFDNAETSTDYNEMMVLENRGDVPNEPISSFDLFEGDEGIELIEFSNEDFEIDDVPIDLLDFSEEVNLRIMFNYYESFFSKKNNFDNLLNYNFYFNNDIAEFVLTKDSGWIQELFFDRFLLNIVSKDFLFPADNELLSLVGIYFDNLNFKYNFDVTLLQNITHSFRDFLTKYMLELKPTNVYRNNIYNTQTLLHLIRRLNYKKIPFKKIYVEYLKRFPKNRLAISDYNQKLLSFRWDSGVDLAVSLYHPHDVLFKLTKNVALFNFVPYQKNFKNFKFQIIPILGFEMFNNSFKRKFFSNVSYYVQLLNLVNYPDLTLNEAERIWSFLGCTKKQWDCIDSDHVDSLIYPYDDWDFPFILVAFLFAIHYHKSNKLRGSIGVRGGSPIGFNIHSRFQVIKRTEKRQKWRKKKLIKPTDQSPLYYSIDFFETIISFFENFLFTKDKFIFFSKNRLINDILVIFLDFNLFFVASFGFLDFVAISNVISLFFFMLMNFLLFCFFKFYFICFIFLFFIVVVYLVFFFINLINIFIWLKVSFFFFYTFLLLLFIMVFKNTLFFVFLLYFFFFFFNFLLNEILTFFFFILLFF
jgi:hypothetical protein